ncbi:MAG: hypothetical protein ACYTHM_04695 [Planctomycetota bacterium]|jgi:hypothetical protein
MRTKLLIGILGTAVLLAPASILPGTDLGAEAYAGGGKLGSLEGALKGGKSSGSRGLKLSSSSKGVIASLLVDFFVHVAPYLLFPRHRFTYQGYPYEFNEGYLQYDGQSPYAAPETVPLHPRAVAFELRGGYMIDSRDLHGYRFYGKARLSWAFNLDFDFTQFREWTNPDTSETLTLIKCDGLFNISNSPWHDIDLGLGFSYIDGVDFFGGVNAKLTGDIYPHRPWGIHFAACANAFPGGTLFETELAVGFFLERVELRVGWRALWVDDVEIHGPMSSVALWF